MVTDYRGLGQRVLNGLIAGGLTTIVSGSALPVPAGTVVRKGAERLRTLSVDGRLVVTWRRAGHTCVLTGMGVTADQLEQLAAYR